MSRQTAVFSLLVLLLSCGTLPVPRDAADSLVLVPVAVGNTADRGLAREFWARFSDGRPEVEIPTDGTAFVVFVVRQPGVRLLEVRSGIRSDRSYVAGGEGLTPVDRELPYRPGQVTVTAWAFVVGMQRVNEAQTVSGIAAVPATRAMAERAVAAALRDPAWKRWAGDD